MRPLSQENLDNLLEQLELVKLSIREMELHFKHWGGTPTGYDAAHAALNQLRLQKLTLEVQTRVLHDYLTQ